MLLRKALELIPEIDREGTPDADILGISYDSRRTQKGHLFVAIKGEKTDGALFVKQALELGAAVVASEQPIASEFRAVSLRVPDARKFLADISRIFYQDPASKMKLVGITGTNGKTTTSFLIDSLFSHAGIRSCLVGTLGMQIGGRHFPSEHTTPEAPDLMQFLHQAVTEGSTHGAMEVSSHSLALKRVFGVRFRVGVFMNLTRDHLDFHKDMESYFSAKQLLFSRENGNGVECAVISVDDPYGKRLAERLHCEVMRFGFSQTAEIHVLECHSRADGTDLTLATPAGNVRFNLPLIGRPNIYNTMAAAGAALCLGMDLDSVREGIEALKGVPGRLERMDAGQDFTVVVDYAHSPDALENLLATVTQLPHRKIITVFGCGGDRDRTKRPIMGEIATRMSDFVFATSDNPRSEDPVGILTEVEAGMHRGPAPYKMVPDRLEAIGLAVSMAETGDVVVIAGKGHEDYQIIGNRSIPFDDRRVSLDLIRKKLAAKGA
jgi:UDP-N-acetylmuramoyl-L-alanyl-D-glutamate--2,6-diaminopimelate ligase